MKCIKCEKPIKGKRYSFDYSEKCGVAGVVIDSAKKYDCKHCGESFIDVGTVDEINEEISLILLTIEHLTRHHLKFIRNHVFGENYFQFAQRIGFNPQYLKDVENLKRPLSREFSDILKTTLFSKYQRKKIKIKIED